MASTNQTCPSNHPLLARDGPASVTGAFVCDVCDARSNPNETSARCAPCDYDKCVGCVAAAKKMRCPSAHLLERFTTPREGFSCDACSAALIAGTCCGSCRQCDYDVCPTCVFAAPSSATADRSVSTPTVEMSFDVLWGFVRQYEHTALPKSALGVLRDVIIPKARSTGDHAQLLKATIAVAKATIETEDVGMDVGIALLERELKPENRAASFIISPAEVCFLHSILGEMYQRYLDLVRYSISSRTDLGEDARVTEDIKLWSPAQLERAAFNHYYQSVENPEYLAKEKTSDYNPLLTTAFDSSSLAGRARPSLLDFLGHRALSYFSSENSFLTEPSNRFVLRDVAAMGDAESFVCDAWQLESDDTTSRKYRALKVYRSMIRIKLAELRLARNAKAGHTADFDSAASDALSSAYFSFIDLDLKRIAFVKNALRGLSDGEKASLYERYLLGEAAKFSSIAPGPGSLQLFVGDAPGAYASILLALANFYNGNSIPRKEALAAAVAKANPPEGDAATAVTAPSCEIAPPQDEDEQTVPDSLRAMEFFEQVIAVCTAYPGANPIAHRSAIEAANQIVTPSLRVTTEGTVAPNAPFIACVESSNIAGVKYRLFKLPSHEALRSFEELSSLEHRDFIFTKTQRVPVVSGAAETVGGGGSDHTTGVVGSLSFAAIAESEEECDRAASSHRTVIAESSEGLVDFNRSPYDYHSSRVEIVLDPIATPGVYFLATVPSDEPEGVTFETSPRLTLTTIRVSRLGVLKANNDSYIVCDRTTGEPLEGVTMSITDETSKSAHEYERGPVALGLRAVAAVKDVLGSHVKTVVSDRNGFFKMPKLAEHHQFSITFTLGNDVYDNRDSHFSSRDYEGSSDSTMTTYFFLDRNIYRPGQTVFFKGLHVKHFYSGKAVDWKEPKILAKTSLTVTAYDANGQVIKGTPITVVTNEFGTFEGSFVTPAQGLTGRMSLSTPHGSASFRCEEYKRPRFEVTMSTPAQNVVVGGKAVVEGSAINFSGIPLANAVVKYRVRRVVSVPWFWCFWGRSPSWSGRSAEILSSATTADEKGKFMIEFTAIPDPDINPVEKPEFSYEVSVDVTDITGETHSASTSMKVGYLGLRVDVPLSDTMSLQSLRSLPIGLTDLNGNAIAAAATVTLEELVAPFPVGCPFVKRYWAAPHAIALPKKTFKRVLPQFAYTDEISEARWPRVAGASYVRTAVSEGGLGAPATIPTDLAGLPTEVKPNLYYRVVVSATDSFGTPITVSRVITVYDEADEASVAVAESGPMGTGNPSLRFTNGVYRIGDTAVVRYGKRVRFDGGLQAVLVALSTVSQEGVLEWDRGGVPPSSAYAALVQQRAVRVKERDRGFIAAVSAFVCYGRAFVATASVSVPWVEKQLSFEYVSFRNKLEPGQQEEWRIKVKSADPKARPDDVVVAEVVASLYDASLDKLIGNGAHSFSNSLRSLFPTPSPSLYLSPASGYGAQGSRSVYMSGDVDRRMRYDRNAVTGDSSMYFPSLDWGGFPFYTERPQPQRFMCFASRSISRSMAMACERRSCPAPMKMKKCSKQKMCERECEELVTANSQKCEAFANNCSGASKDVVEEADGEDDASGDVEGDADFSPKVRTDLKETVFFMPTLRTEADGTIVLRFTMGEALTRWRLLAFAHTTDLKAGTHSDGTIVTQKELMVTPNPPRFLREGDGMLFSAKVSNVSPSEKQGTATLELIDGVTGTTVNGLFGLHEGAVTFCCGPAGSGTQSALVSWPISVPYSGSTPFSSVLTWRVVAKAGRTGDGEESTIPVLTNRMLVTETMPMSVRGGTSRTFTLKHMAEREQSPTLAHESYTVEFTSNPAWYAVQAMPYLMEFPHECSEQLFSRLYSNALASHITAKTPAIRRVFEAWRLLGSESLKSNLTRNEELKAALLEETPWVMAAQSEEKQKQQIALLFDLNKMASERTAAIAKLCSRQAGDGGFAWFPGGRSNRFITQHIAMGFAHLQNLGIDIGSEGVAIMKKAQRFCLSALVEDYKRLLRQIEESKGAIKLTDQHVSHDHLLFLYTLSFGGAQQRSSGDFASLVSSPDEVTAVAYYYMQAATYWLNFNLYGQGLIALIHQRGVPSAPATTTPQAIIASLKERALTHDELGAYWKWNNRGYAYYEAPIETHALMIEVFSEVAKDVAFVDELRLWLLKNKQTKHWKTTKQTTAAIYALLLGGSDWLQSDRLVEVTVGGTPLPMANAEPGTGYVKHRYGKEILNEPSCASAMATITVANPNSVVAWGAAYWQYFETLENIKGFEETPLKIRKELFLVTVTEKGEVLRPLVLDVSAGSAINNGAGAFALGLGDKVRVRMEIVVDREMSYVHLKDMRASGLEPTNVMSNYKWQDGLGYYECTKDVATHFFIDYLPKCTFVLEYTLVASQRGSFSNGITTMQCMYAPEFSSHSEGVRLSIN